jgi:hypothetical protein
MGLLEENAAISQKAGVTVTINTDDSVTESRFMLRTGRDRGARRDDGGEALKALTINAAKVLHLDARLGSLEAGKDADFVVLSGAPFSVYTQVRQTWIEGKKVFDVETDRGYQTGGFALPAGEKLPISTAAVGLDAAHRCAACSTGRRRNQGARSRSSGHTSTPGRDIFRAFAGHHREGRQDRDVVAGGDVHVKNMPSTRRSTSRPGLIDAFSLGRAERGGEHPGRPGSGRVERPNQGDLRALDGFNPREPLLDFLRANGTTGAPRDPGPAEPAAGRGGVFRADGSQPTAAALVPVGAVVVNLGESSKGGRGRPPAWASRSSCGRRSLTLRRIRRASRRPRTPKHEALIPRWEGEGERVLRGAPQGRHSDGAADRGGVQAEAGDRARAPRATGWFPC